MKKTSLMIAFVGMISTAMFANAYSTFQDGAKKTEKPAKLTKTKPVKRLSAAKAIENPKTVSKENKKVK